MGIYLATTATVLLPLTHAIGVLLPDMVRDLKMTPLQAGFLGSLTWLALFLLSIPFSLWLARYSPKLVILLALVGSGLFALWQGLADSYNLLLLGRWFFVVLMVTRLTSVTLVKLQWFPLREMGTINGLEAMVSPVAQTLGLAFIPFLIEVSGGWRPVFFIFAGGLFLFALLWMLLGRDRITPEYQRRIASQGKASWRSALRYSEPWLMGLGDLGHATTWMGFMVFWPTFLIEYRDLPLTTAGFFMSLFSVGATISSFGSGYASDRLGLRKPFIWLPGLLLPGGYLAMITVANLPLLGVVAFVTGLLAYGYWAAMLTVPFELPKATPHDIMMVRGVLTTVSTMGGIIGGPLVGGLFQATGSLHTAMALSCFFPFTLVLVSLRLRETGWRRRQVPRVE